MGNSESQENKLFALYQKKGFVAKDLPDLSDEELVQVNADLQSFCGTSAVSGGVMGGGHSRRKNYVGGLDSMQSYGNSVYSQAKEQLIRDIAEDVFKALGVKANAKSDSIDKVIDALIKQVPNPKNKDKNNARRFSSVAENQVKACKILGTAINKHYEGNLIPVNGAPAEMCTAVAEVMESLATGLHTEFIGVAGDILRAFRNMQVLQDFLRASYKKQQEIVNKSGDVAAKQQSEAVAEFYSKIDGELERQIAIISNLLNVTIGPTGKSLISLLEDNKEFNGLVRDLKAELGTTQFGEKIAYLLSGVSSSARAAELVDKALKKVGVSVAEFKNTKGPGELRLKISAAIQNKHPSSKELDELMAAAEIIYNNSYNHQEIADVLSGKKTGGCGCMGANDDENELDDEDRADVMGGADDELGDDGLPVYWSRKSLGRKIKKKKAYRELLLKDFSKVLKSHYRRIVDAADNIANNIGSSIPVDDDLRNFVEAFNQLQSLDQENLHVMLSGYPQDSTSKEVREVFLNKYRVFNKLIDPLIKKSGNSSQHFSAMKTSSENLIKAIDSFSDNIVKSLTEIHIDRPDEIRAAVKETSMKLFGADEHGVEGGAAEGSITSNYVDFKTVQNEMLFKMNTAHIMENLKIKADEIENYGQDYEQVLGEEAAWMIDQIKSEHNAKLDAANPHPTTGAPAAGSIGALIVAVVGAVVAAGGQPAVSAETRQAQFFKNYKYVLDRQTNAKIKMVELAQAVDLYLKAFSDGIARHPLSIDTVAELRNILQQVAVVAKWFTAKSGDSLATLFECFPAGFDGTAAVLSTDAPVLNDNGTVNANAVLLNDRHYYEWAEDRVGAGATTLGNPFLGVDIETNKKIEGMFKLAEKTVKSIQAFSNLMQVFNEVGNQYGDIAPQAKTFMTPALISNAVTEYIVASAFAMHFAPRMEEVLVGLYRTMQDVDPTTQPDRRRGTSAQADIPVDGVINATYRHTHKLAQYHNEVIGGRPDNAIDGNLQLNGLLSGVQQSNVAAATNAMKLEKKTNISLAGLPDDSRQNQYWSYHDPANRGARSLLSGWDDAFYDTDMLFVMSVKSIVCKVFTVLDTYRLFHRKLTETNRDQYDSLNTVRTILGGKDKHGKRGGASYVKIIPEAVELYVRLVPLVEWYREKFGINERRRNIAAPGDWVLTLVANDGIFSNLVRIVFDQNETVREGNYTESQLQNIIEAINEIYSKYKAKEGANATPRAIINAFVVEVNRVFGFIKREDIHAYLDERRQYLNTPAVGDEEGDNNQYDLLGSDDVHRRGPAPSDKFLTVAERNLKQRRQRTLVHLMKEIKDLQLELFNDFRAVQRDPIAANSFRDSIKNVVREIQSANGEQDKYNIVLRTMQGSNTISKVLPDKLIMLHESVTAPLLVLYNLYKVIARYNALLHGTSVRNIRAFAAGGAATYLNHLQVAYPKDAVPNEFRQVQEFARVSTGGYIGAANAPNLSVILRDTLSAILDLCSDQHKLITCNVNRTSINVDWSKLEEVCQSLSVSIKQNLDKMRIEFVDQPGIIRRFENRENVGSVSWLDEQLFEILFKDRDQTGLQTAHGDHLNHPDGLLVACSNPANGSVAYAFQQCVYYGDRRDDLSTENVVNDLKTFPFNILPISVDVDLQTVEQKAALQASNANAAVANVDHINSVLAAPVLLFTSRARLNTWNTDGNHDKSLMMAFNKVLHMYLRDNFEDGTMKFYMPLIESFMNSAAAFEVVQGKSFPNIGSRRNVAVAHDDNSVVAPGAAGAVAAPAEGSVLFASNALIMKALANAMDMRLKRKRYAYESLASIPEHMIDRMHNNLPLYIKLFSLIYQRAELLKRLINSTGLKDNIAIQGGGARLGNHLHAGAGVELDNGAKNAVQFTNYLSNMLNRIMELANSIRSCASSVLNELPPSPVYFMDVSKNFLLDFNKMHGGTPFMPASHALLPFVYAYSGRVDANAPEHNLLLPNSAHGSFEYKFNRASRSLLVSADDKSVSMNLLPGASKIYEWYSSVARKDSTISKSDYENTVLKSIRFAKFLNDGSVFSRLFTWNHDDLRFGGSGYGSTSVFGATLSVARNINANVINGNDAFALLRSPAVAAGAAAALQQLLKNGRVVDGMFDQTFVDMRDIIIGIENPNVAGVKEDMARRVGDVNANIQFLNRMQYRILNILDMSIVPVNLHAFMREVPFTNLINYSYTFDRLIHDFLMTDELRMANRNYPMIEANTPTHTTKHLFAKMLIHPHADLTPYTRQNDVARNTEYYALTASVFNGNDSLHLGTPKFLSDQLWHKVLLNGSAQFVNRVDVANINRNTALEAGPAGYEVIRANIGQSDRALASRRTIQSFPGVANYPYNNVLNAAPIFNPGLKFYHNATKKWVTVAGNPMPAVDVNYHAELGKARYDTKLVRNLTWIIQLQRIVRALFVHNLSWINKPVINGVDFIDQSTTEVVGNDQYDRNDFNGVNYEPL